MLGSGGPQPLGTQQGVVPSRASTPGLPPRPRDTNWGISHTITPRGLKSRKQKHYATIFGGFKRADREIVALDFLLNIPMKNEGQILQQARQHVPASDSKSILTGAAQEEEPIDLLDSPAAFTPGPAGATISDLSVIVATDGASKIPGRRLDGPNAHVLRVPPSFRYKVRGLHEQAAVVRQWESALVVRAGLLDARHFLSSNRGYPVGVSSVIKYKPGMEEDKRLRAKQADERGAEAFQMPVRDWRGTTLSKLLHAEWAPCSAERDAEEGHRGAALQYDPCVLDDPSMVQGKNRQVTVGDSSMGPVIFSVILFVNPKQLKDELNRQFRDKNPSLPPSLTLSKIRSLKRQALAACRALDVEVGTVALACVYFEKLCLKGLVTKSNRRVAFGACLTLAYKFNELSAQRTSKLPLILDFIDREWFTSNKQVFEAEFGVFYHLDFALHCQVYEVSHHFGRLLKMLEIAPKDYLGEDMLIAYKASLPTTAEAAGEDGAGGPRNAATDEAANEWTDPDRQPSNGGVELDGRGGSRARLTGSSHKPATFLRRHLKHLKQAPRDSSRRLSWPLSWRGK